MATSKLLLPPARDRKAGTHPNKNWCQAEGKGCILLCNCLVQEWDKVAQDYYKCKIEAVSLLLEISLRQASKMRIKVSDYWSFPCGERGCVQFTKHHFNMSRSPKMPKPPVPVLSGPQIPSGYSGGDSRALQLLVQVQHRQHQVRTGRVLQILVLPYSSSGNSSGGSSNNVTSSDSDGSNSDESASKARW